MYISSPPDLLPKALRQPLILAINLLPSRESLLQDTHFLLLGRLLAQRRQQSVSLAEILERGEGPPLLAERAVEDDCLLVLDFADEGGHQGV